MLKKLAPCSMLLAFCIFALTATAQKREKYEYDYDIPVYIDSIHANLTYPLAWRNCSGSQSFKEWRQKARQKVFDLMGPAPPKAANYDMEIIAEEQRDGYKAQKIAFNLSRWYRVSAYLLIPDKKGKKPAVNLLHDHGAHLYIGKEKMIRPIAESDAVKEDADKWVSGLYGGRYLGDELARLGYVVFSIDAPMWGERGRKEGVSRDKYDIIAGNMMELGRDLCAFMHYDDVESTEFLATLPCVDAKRIACAGLSMGAYRTWMLAALSDRIKVGCAVCWMVTTDAQLTKKYGRKENGGFANCIPMVRNWLDYPDIASLACPKPMLFIAGKKDKLFPIPGVEKAFSIMHDVWNSQKKNNLQTYLLDQGHECNLENQQTIIDFLQKYL